MKASWLSRAGWTEASGFPATIGRTAAPRGAAGRALGKGGSASIRLDLPIGHSRALRRFSQKGLDFGPAQVPAPAARMLGKKPADPGYIVRDGFLLCPGFPQYGDVSLRPARLGIQRRHAPTSRLRHIIPGGTQLGMLFLTYNIMFDDR